ncbi:MAG: ribonuclease P protein component [Candidatus Paceibacterota bacterium]
MNYNKNTIFSVRENPPGFQKKPLLVVVGKKVAAQATKRNLIRRRIIAALRSIRPTPMKDITVIAKPPITTTSFETILQEIKNLFITK